MDFTQFGKTAFTAEMIWYYAAIALYIAVELGIASWIVEFLQKIRAQSIAQKHPGAFPLFRVDDGGDVLSAAFL